MVSTPDNLSCRRWQSASLAVFRNNPVVCISLYSENPFSCEITMPKHLAPQGSNIRIMEDHQGRCLFVCYLY